MHTFMYLISSAPRKLRNVQYLWLRSRCPCPLQYQSASVSSELVVCESEFLMRILYGKLSTLYIRNDETTGTRTDVACISGFVVSNILFWQQSALVKSTERGVLRQQTAQKLKGVHQQVANKLSSSP